MSTQLLFFAAIVCFLPATNSLRFGVVEEKRCNMLNCVPHLVRVQFAELEKMMNVLARDVMEVANLTDVVYDEQVEILVDSCHKWTAFSTCMGASWIDCFDVGAMAALANSVAGEEIANQAEGKSSNYGRPDWMVDPREIDILDENGKLTGDSLAKVGIEEKTIRKGVQMVDSLCAVADEYGANAVCVRNSFFKEQEFTNMTVRWLALKRSQCLEFNPNCPQFSYFMKIHRFYVNKYCKNINKLVDIVLRLMVDVDGTEDGLTSCQEWQAVKDLPFSTEPTASDYTFGANFSEPFCNDGNISMYYDLFYEHAVGKYRDTMIDKYGWTFNGHYMWDGFHPEVFWTTTLPPTTSSADKAEVMRNEEPVDYQDGEGSDNSGSDRHNLNVLFGLALFAFMMK